ncbi:MAG: hypothetical protein GY851_05680 [bacterium]|nr:hypothetical protein [bacterium]
MPYQIIVVDDNPRENIHVDTLIDAMQVASHEMGLNTGFPFVRAAHAFRDPFVVYRTMSLARYAQMNDSTTLGLVLDSYSKDPTEGTQGGRLLAEILLGQAAATHDAQAFASAQTSVFGKDEGQWPVHDPEQLVADATDLFRTLPCAFYTNTYLDINYPNTRVFKRDGHTGRDLIDYIVAYWEGQGVELAPGFPYGANGPDPVGEGVAGEGG